MKRSCPICQENTLTIPYLRSTVDRAKVSTLTFASRKTPEFMSYEMVICRNCDLAFSVEPTDVDQLATAYHEADFDSEIEAEDAAHSYLTATRNQLLSLQSREYALEIGTGTGAFLERLKDFGFSRVVGVEPSQAAIDAAPQSRKSWIRKGVFVETDFDHESFDLICCFMTLEHVEDPLLLAKSAFRLLKPGGLFAVVVHDRRSIINRILGKRSPIIDIEHLQLFSHQSLVSLLDRAGFQSTVLRPFANRYRLGYWLKLVPLPPKLRNLIVTIVKKTGIGAVRLSLNVGNVVAVGTKR
jgi:SAM-dependent methyltransferase